MNSDIVQCGDLKFKKLYNREEVQEKINDVARKIDEQFQKTLSQDPKAKFLLVGILNGAFMFTSELVKRLKTPIFVDFIRISSYKGTVSGQLAIESKINHQMYKDAYVLIVDDICDTGKTLLQLSTKMKELEVKKVWISVLVSRPDKFHETQPDFIGMPCSEFIIGFGLDYNQHGRQYPEIYQKVNQ